MDIGDFLVFLNAFCGFSLFGKEEEFIRFVSSGFSIRILSSTKV
jgi:hypothetical protein